MNNKLSKKISVLALALLLSVSSLGGFSSAYGTTVDAVTSATKPTKVVIDPKATFTLVIDAANDYKLVFDNQLVLIDIKSINQPTLNLDALKGKTFSQVIVDLKAMLIPVTPSTVNIPPVIIGFGSDLITKKQALLVKNSIASALKASPVLIMGLSDVQTTQVMNMGANYLNTLNKATLETFIGNKPLTDAQYEWVTQNESIMKAIGNVSNEITYKAADKTVFDEHAVINSGKHSDDDDDDDYDDTHHNYGNHHDDKDHHNNKGHHDDDDDDYDDDDNDSDD